VVCEILEKQVHRKVKKINRNQRQTVKIVQET